MLDNCKRRPGILVEHQDGRKGIAYHNDQIERFSKRNEVIVRFFNNNDFKQGLSKEKRSVKNEKLITIGLID